ncbi:hypothetical protein SAMN05216378_1394 [Paenibacillus catalpae]|uniref:Uncharacterized protein n=1 Tax=Paenibacillus catalpae TaxID=1045775 RepID=A0A1I1VC11_9BACL|nr:hypothetical protein [Paenibacillus catalpae]SFD77960.1 hypothetical protein SAMN05216378_1394 [Paenibacillus catalpae]
MQRKETALSIIHSVKHPSRIKNIAALSILSLLWCYMVIHAWSDISWHDKGDIIILSGNIVVFFTYLIILIISIIRALNKPTELSILPDEIQINGRTILAKEIKVIINMGYFRPVIGIKPIGKMVVPVKLCFRFLENGDQGIADIKGWAAANKIKMVNRDFMTWL